MFGYNNIYDKLADNSGPSILGVNKINVNVFNIITKKFYFTYKNTNYRVQLWKGRYGPGIGCEMGIYTDTNGSNFIEDMFGIRHYGASSVNYDMSIQLRDSSNNRQIFFRKDNTWWINGFVADNSSLDDLTMDAQISFADIGMAKALENSITKAREESNNQDITVNIYKGVINITWASKNFTDQH